MKPEARQRFHKLRSVLRLRFIGGCMVAVLMLLLLAGNAKASTPKARELKNVRTQIRKLENRLAELRTKLRDKLAVDEQGMPIVAPAPLPDADGDQEVVDTDGIRYPVSQIILEYSVQHPGHPPLEEVLASKVQLVRTPTGFIAPREGMQANTIRLWDLTGMDNVYFYGSAIRKISVGVVGDFNQMGIIGVFVGPDPSQINARGEDLRTEGDTTLRLIIRTAVISEIRTLASGDRFPLKDRINNPAHDRLLRNLPMHPGVSVGSDDLLRRDVLDRYIARLNRHPGRRVDAAVSAADSGEPGDVALDLLVSEVKPWTVYFQIANTGTDETGRWRQRFGFTNNQLTNNDDVLQIDYITSGFTQSHSVVVSYEAPLFDSEKYRWRIFGGYSQYYSSEVGFANAKFRGSQYNVGGELIRNIYQNENNLFIDAFAGLEYKSISIDNELIVRKSKGDFLFASIGIKGERHTDTSSTTGQIRIRRNLENFVDSERDVFDSSTGTVSFLGRGMQLGSVDAGYTIVDWNVATSFYLEPLFNRKAWDDVTTPGSSTLAHEIYFAFRGQSTFGTRVNSEETRTLGGLYGVRGFKESEATGDSAVLFTAEYRLHIPRLFPIKPDPSTQPRFFGKPFRWAPQQVYGRPDWDLVLKGFYDLGASFIAVKQGFEQDNTLMSAGVGLELLFKRNVSIRAEWGMALSDGELGGTRSGDGQFHFVTTILY